MLKALRSLFEEDAGTRPASGLERHHLHIAAASLMHEATRVDLVESDEERTAALAALSDLFGLDAQAGAMTLDAARDKAKHLTSYYGPVSVVKRDMDPAGRLRFIGHLWRIAYADGRLDPYEDHYVRKIGHLLYVPNTDLVLARNQARANVK